jgi:hypothetical protein
MKLMDITRIEAIHNYILFEYKADHGMRVGYYRLEGGNFNSKRIKPLDDIDAIVIDLDTVYNIRLADQSIPYYADTVNVIEESPLSTPQLIEVKLPGDYFDSRVVRSNLSTFAFDPDKYEYNLLKIRSSRNDGSMISITMAYHRDLGDALFNEQAIGSESVRPVVIMAYDSTIDSSFDHRIVPLLDMKFIVVMVHPVSLDLSNFNAYDRDFYNHVVECADNVVDCLRRLIDEGITVPEMMVIQTLNESGALMPAIIAKASDLFAVGLMDAPCGDCFISNPEYSPPTFIPSGNYPSTYITTDSTDQWHPGLEATWNYQTLLHEADPQSQHEYSTSADTRHDDYIRSKMYVYAINVCALKYIQSPSEEYTSEQSSEQHSMTISTQSPEQSHDYDTTPLSTQSEPVYPTYHSSEEDDMYGYDSNSEESYTV